LPSPTIAAPAPNSRLALHRVGERWLALELDGLASSKLALSGLTARRPERLELSPDARAPVVWRFRDADLSGRLLSVVGWLDGGLVSVSTAGTLYVAASGGEARALYLPGAGQTVTLGKSPPRTLVTDGRKKPLYPPEWPAGAVSCVIRRRLRTIVVLAKDAMLAELADQA
jgi:hypothetical protein